MLVISVHCRRAQIGVLLRRVAVEGEKWTDHVTWLSSLNRIGKNRMTGTVENVGITVRLCLNKLILLYVRRSAIEINLCDQFSIYL